MEFNEKSILFASLLGSKVAQQIPRFETVQNEIGKRVLPPISFLPFNNIKVKINTADDELGEHSTGGTGIWKSDNQKEKERLLGYNSNDLLWMADAPKSKSEQFFPFTFIDGKNRYTLPYEPMISISSANNIVERTVAKAGSDAQYEGTVKERWSRGDWEIKITGVLIGSILTGDVSQCFPKSDFEKLRDILQLRKNWEINCSPLELLGINSIVIYDMNFPFTKGENVQAYEITAKSDFDFNLLLEEKDVLQSLDWEIKFKTGSKTFKLLMLLECEIEKNVENLADVAVITLPETVLNQALKVKDKIGRGSEVTIKTGYNGDLKTEFIGFVRDITTDGSLKIQCEDALFLFRRGIKDKMLKSTSVKKIADYVCSEIGEGYKVVVEGDLAYEKFVIHQATGYDVLMKLQEETKYNIYFNTEKKELHIHPPFTEKGGYVIYCMQKNIEKSSLEYKKAIDRKFELTIEKTKKDGTVVTEKIGQSGGETKTLKVGSLDAKSVKMRAEAEFKEFASDMYEGSFDTWLIPYCEPTYSAKIVDFDYPEQSAIYYVKATKVNISSSGGIRTITPGIKLATVK